MDNTTSYTKHGILSSEDESKSQCPLCGYEYEYKARYCIQCGASLNGDSAAAKSPEWMAAGEFLELGKALSSTLDLYLLLKKIDDSAVRLTDAAAGTIMLYDEGKTSLRFRSSFGAKATALNPSPVRDGIAWWVGAHGIPARVEDASSDPRFTAAIDKITGFATRDLLCVPMTLENETIGVIEVLNKSDGTSFAEQDEQLLSVLASQAAVAVKNARLATEQRNFFDHVIEMLVMAIESTRLVPEGHCWRVAKLSTAIGRRLGIQDQELQNLYYAAALHDLGVLKLRKSGVVEKSRMKLQPVLGANMVRDIKMLRGAEFMIRHHHEFLDGSGYPDGLKDEELSLGTRIISVVEAYEEAKLKNENHFMAETHVHESSAKLFDAVVVDAFLELIAL